MLLIASTISTALSFQTDFSSRSKRGFVPVPWFFATRYLYIFSSPLTLFFFFFFFISKRDYISWRIYPRIERYRGYFLSFFFVPSRKRKNEEKPSLKNSENLEIKPYKKKLHFLYYFRRCSNAKKTSGWNREKRVVGRFLLYTVWPV